MNLVKIKPLEAFHFLRQKKIPKILEKDYCLLSDSFFDIGIAYFQDRKPVRKTYFPLGYQKEEKEKFSLIEIVDKKESILIRSRIGKEVSAEQVDLHFLGAKLKKHSRFYTSFSVEPDFLDYSFENHIDSAFSLLHFHFEAFAGYDPFQSMAIIADPSGNLSNAYQEGFELFQFLKKILPDLQLSFISSSMNCEEFEAVLSRCSVVHFSGHIEKKGIQIGKEFYHPAFSRKKLPSLLYLNACTLHPELLQGFIERSPQNMIYSRVNLEDQLGSLTLLKYFYLGLFSGYRIGDIAKKTLDFRKTRLYGWMTNKFNFQQG
mgnify:CR=1 FL=1